MSAKGPLGEASGQGTQKGNQNPSNSLRIKRKTKLLLEVVLDRQNISKAK